MEYAGKITQESNEHINTITTCIYGWWRLYGYHLHKASFSLQQRSIFYLTTKFVENIEKVPPTQSQNNNYQPNKLI